MAVETPDTVHGRLLEAVHISGYSFERACSELEWLIAKDRWKTVGRGFADVDDFLQTIDWSGFRLAIKQRQPLVKRLQELGAGQYPTARLLGVNQSTIRRDLGLKQQPNKAKASKHAQQATESLRASDVAEALASKPFRPATDPYRGEKIGAARAEREANTRATLRQQSPIDNAIHHGDFRKLYTDVLLPDCAHLVLTDPPYDADSVGLFGAVGFAAARVLRPGGSLLVYSGQKYFADVAATIAASGLHYWWMFALQHGGEAQMLQKLGVRCHWKPILWFVKETRGDVSAVIPDVVDGGGREKDRHEWQQGEGEAAVLVERFTKPGDLVVDFCAGSGTVLAAAKKLDRRFVGFETRADCVAQIMERVA